MIYGGLKDGCCSYRGHLARQGEGMDDGQTQFLGGGAVHAAWFAGQIQNKAAGRQSFQDLPSQDQGGDGVDHQLEGAGAFRKLGQKDALTAYGFRPGKGFPATGGYRHFSA